MNIIRRILSALILPACFMSLQAADAPKYIFYYIGDGMGFNHVLNAQIFSDEVLRADSTLTMLRFPVASMARTHSASSDVTDSAAAGTALATGRKTRNNMLGMDADTVPVTSVARHLQKKGYGIGLVTSVGIDDATPAAFYAHVPNRGDFYDIDRALAESGYQFTAGAGLRGTKDKEGKHNGMMKHFDKNKVSVCYVIYQIDKKAKK
ncbi:MAG: alkaline phosphatase, partial [Muribaculaceae bacterium]|nr:alkaline phosphatase [Muribaculaceae bacterium]